MSEFWKSTPKYWCKHCKTFVRDTKLERQNHDATPKHQGNLKRFLRDLHRGHEKDEKDKDRAKSEVARLNGLVSGSNAGESSTSSRFGRGPTPTVSKPQATPSQRKQQLAQLAEMGVSIPDEFRGEMAMAGEWQVTSERVIHPTEIGEKKPEALGFGVRKRAVEDEEAGEALQATKRKWGSTYRTQPKENDDLDLDQLLNNSTAQGNSSMAPSVKKEPMGDGNDVKAAIKSEKSPQNDEAFTIKREPSNDDILIPKDKEAFEEADFNQVTEKPPGEIVFKKRPKAKNMRQK